jgi:hypothetical protein
MRPSLDSGEGTRTTSHALHRMTDGLGRCRALRCRAGGPLSLLGLPHFIEPGYVVL